MTMFRRLLAALLTLCLLCLSAPSLSASAEETSQAADTSLLPTLHISAEYFDWTKDGAISGDFVLECRYPEDPAGNVSGAPGTVLSIEGLNGLTLAGESPEKISVGDLSCGETFEFSLSLQYDESLATQKNEQGNIEPILHIAATSGAIGGCSYTCIFDITPTPRAYLLGVNTEPYLLNAYSCAQGIDSLAQKLEGFYYDTQPLEVHSMTADISDPGAQDVLSLLNGALHCGADENDVTYIYLCAQTTDENGAPVSGVRGISGGRSVTVGYDEILSKAAEELTGRIILICDGQYGGLAPYSAAVSALDPEYCNVIGVNSPTAPEGSAMYTGLLAQSMAEMQGTISVSGFTGSVSGTGSAVNSFLKATTGSVMTAYHSGSSSNLFFSSDPNFDSGVRILAVKEEKCIVNTVDALHLYYQYLREHALLGNHMMSTPAISNIARPNYWSDLAQNGAQGFSSAVVCDLDKNGTQDMLAVYWTYDYAEETDKALNGYANGDPEHLCMRLYLYQIENGEVVLADSVDHATYLDNYVHDSYGFGSVTLVEADGIISISCVFSFNSSMSHNGGNGILCHVEDGKFVKGCGRTIVEHSDEITKAHGQHYLRNLDHLDTIIPGDAAFVEFYQTNIPECISYFMYGDGNVGHDSVAFKNWDFTNLNEILLGTKQAEYYDLVVLPDYVAPPISTGSEHYCELITSIVQDVFPGADITANYANDSHQSFTVRIPGTITAMAYCTAEGIPTLIDIRSDSGVDEWTDEFQMLFDSILALPETGLSPDEYAQLSGYRLKRYEDFRTANDRVHGQFLPQPMYEDYAILMIYLDLQ